jgi:hypothetical protein
MVRLVTTDGKPVLVAEVKKSEPILSPGELLDQLCGKCFLERRHYLGSLSDTPPFNKERARQIMTIMMSKGLTDPRAFALGQALKLNWRKFGGIK